MNLMFDHLSSEVFYLLLALVSGVFMAVQGSLNAALSKGVGLREATFVVQLTGLILMACVWLALRERQMPLVWSQVPWYAYLGGVLGVAIVYLVAASIPTVGVTAATTAIIVGQVSTAFLIDSCGLFGLERLPCHWQQIGGLALFASGAWLLLK